MSCYVNFFIKNGDKFAPIGSMCRSSEIFQAFQDVAPWEKVRALTATDLAQIKDRVRDKVEDLKSYRKQLLDNRALVPTFNNSVEDKMNALEEIDMSLDPIEDRLDEFQYALNFIRFLEDMIEEARTSSYYEEDSAHLDAAHYVYVGTECGYNPEIQD